MTMGLFANLRSFDANPLVRYQHAHQHCPNCQITLEVEISLDFFQSSCLRYTKVPPSNLLIPTTGCLLVMPECRWTACLPINRSHKRRSMTERRLADCERSLAAGHPAGGRGNLSRAKCCDRTLYTLFIAVDGE